jgi:hypothetical protein
MNSTETYSNPIITRSAGRQTEEAFNAHVKATVGALKAGKSKAEALRIGNQVGTANQSSPKHPPKK